MERAKRVEAQMKKIRAKRIQNRKLERESYFLSKEAEKITNPLKPIKNPKHLIGEIIEIELDDDFDEDVVVKYKFKDWTRYARLIERRTNSALFSVFEIDPTNTDESVNAISCSFKNRRLKKI
jgi:hypothetical protein